MKILYTYFHSYEDMPYHSREWVEAAIQLGHEVRVLTVVPPEFLKKIGWAGKVQVIQVHRPKLSGKIGYLILLKNFTKTLLKVSKDFQPDIVYERFSFVSLATASIFAGHSKAIYCIELNGIAEDEARLFQKRFSSLFFLKLIERYVFKHATKIITVTERIRQWVLEKYKIAPSKIKFIPNGVNTERFKPYDKLESRKKFGIPEGAFVMGYLGSIFCWQDFDLLINSADKLKQNIPELYIMLGGKPKPGIEELRKKVQKKGLESFFNLSGFIPWDDASQFISCFDIAVSLLKNFSPDYEFSPQKLLAYFSCSVPVISSDIPGETIQLITKENLGSTYSSHSATDFEHAVMKLYTLKGEKLKSIGRKAREIVMKNYSWNTIVQKSLEFILQ